MARSDTFSSVVTLASWRLRRTWFLLCVTTLGMITAVVITCAVPLFITVTTTAGLRNALAAQPVNSEIRLDTRTLGASTQLVADVHNQFEPLIQHNLGNVLKQPTQFMVQADNLTVVSPQPPVKSYGLVTYATPIAQAAPHLRVVQGRLPRMTNDANGIEIVLTSNTAQVFGVHVGSIMKLRLNYFLNVPDFSQADYAKNEKATSVNAHVVGLISVDGSNLAYWHGVDFTPTKEGGGLVGSSIEVYALLSSDTADTRYSSLEGYDGYSADGPPPYPYLTNVNPFSPLFPDVGAPGSLEQFRERTTVARIPATVIAAQILVLVLFFVSLMTDLLVDRQADAIMVLRSRGASRRQIFGALMTQSVGLGLLAIVIGLPLTLFVVILVAQRILPSQVQDSLNVITAEPLQSLQGVAGYAIVVVIVVLATMSFSLLRVVRMDVLAARREAARSTRRPVWQRLHLDIMAGVVALLGYGITLYLTTIGSLLSDQIKAISSALFSLISPYFLIVVLLLLFLRFFPLLLRLGAWFTVRGRSAASMLALAQMARSPRQSLRMTTLLALTIAFALFSLVFFASQEQRINDLAAYQAGADFSGILLTRTYTVTPQQQEAQYLAIQGVTFASAGFAGDGTLSNNDVALALDLRGVDSETYRQTALWPAQSSSQSLATLTSLLAAKRAYGIQNGVVPVIVDETTHSKLFLHLGSTFPVSVNGLSLAPDMRCIVVGFVEHIPTVYNDATGSTSAFYAPHGGMLFDYQTYNTIYSQQVQVLNKGRDILPVNWILLRTKDDASSLNRVRAALNTLELNIAGLADRRALIESLRVDPLTLTLEGVLSIGTVATLFLAILGDLLASWSSAHARLTNFAVLRALGTSPRQVANVLTWEQGLIYSIGILLGIAFGVLLATTVVPTLIYYGLSVQISLPVQIIVPISLVFTLAAVIAVFVFALGMMVRTVSQPSMSQTLRLNED